MFKSKGSKKNKTKVLKTAQTIKHGKIQKAKNVSKTIIKIASVDNLEKSTTETKPGKRKYTMPSKSITEDLIHKCVDAVMKLSEHSKNQNRIFEDETPIFAELHCMKIQNVRGNVCFTLPHSTVSSTGEVCLITPDLKKGKKSDHEPTIDHWEDLMKKAEITTVKTILPMRQLRVEYDQFELKRRLLTQHDFIMVDTRVINHVSHLLGKMFFKKHNMLVPVRINESKLKKCIENGLRKAILRLNIGETSTIVVGHTGMKQKEVRENVMALVGQLKDKFPGGEANIRAISLKLPLSLSVPLYVTLRSCNSVHVPRLTQNKPKNYKVLEDEISTIPGGRVTVAPDGIVHIKRNAMPEDSDMEEDADITEEPEQSAGEDTE